MQIRWQIGILIFLCKLSIAQFHSPAGMAGSNAMHADSNAFVAWAKACTVVRGFQDISNTSLGKASVGDSSFVTAKADAGVVSLGDGGVAIITFSAPITNGPGYDFAVFENAFNDTFLELAFVEVSSDGINYVRFPATCNLQDTLQYDNSGILDAKKINNLAGKYRVLFGTPFDLQELAGTTSIDITSITHVKLIDVIGSLNHSYASYDSNNHIINDPWPTPFNSSGFDLDAVGVINQKAVGIDELNSQSVFKTYPNPAQDELFILTRTPNEKTEITISDLTGNILIRENTESNKNMIDISALRCGIYFVMIENVKSKQISKLIKQ